MITAEGLKQLSGTWTNHNYHFISQSSRVKLHSCFTSVITTWAQKNIPIFMTPSPLKKKPKKWDCPYQTSSEDKRVLISIPCVREVSYLCKHPELKTSQWLLKGVNQRRVHQSGCSLALPKISVAGIGILASTCTHLLCWACFVPIYLRPSEFWNMTSAWLWKLLHGHLTYPFQDKIPCPGLGHNQRPGLESTTTGPCSPLQSSATTLCLEKCKFFQSRMPMNDLIRT